MVEIEIQILKVFISYWFFLCACRKKISINIHLNKTSNVLFLHFTLNSNRLTEQLTVVGHLELDPRYKLHHPHSPCRKGSTKKEKQSHTFAQVKNQTVEEYM